MKFEMKNRLKPCAALSAVIIVIALVMSMMGMGMNLGIDFTGGTLMTYDMNVKTFDTADISAALAECGVTDAQIAVTGEDKDRLAAHMRELAGRLDYAFFSRDADNVDYADAVVLFGMEEQRRGLNGGCQYCHFADCADCAEKNGLCAWDAMDVGIAIGSAAAAAADARVDNRVMFSVGRAARSLGLLGASVTLVLGIPLSVSGKSPFFDRKPKK